MTYTQHLNSFYAKQLAEKQLSPAHISLYLAIWHSCSCSSRNVIQISPKLLMQLSGISKKCIFEKCLSELHQWGYTAYHTPVRKGSPARTSVIEWPCSYEQYDQFVLFMSGGKRSNNTRMKQSPPTAKVKDMGSLLLRIDVLPAQSRVAPAWDEVLTYFIQKGFPARDAAWFFNYYEDKAQASGIDWKAAADKWCNEQFEPRLYIAAGARAQRTVNPRLQ